MTPSTTKCFCGQSSVGYITNLTSKKYLCNRHWYAQDAQLNKWLNNQFRRQWGDQEWFKELATPKRNTGKQFKLL